MDYEAMRPARARAMFEFLVRRQVWLGCRDWESLSQEVKDAFTDMVALLAEPALSVRLDAQPSSRQPSPAGGGVF